jgi:hypothetical protein
VLVYRHTLLDEQHNLLHGTAMRACSPRCTVLIGHARKQLGEDRQKQLALELFRGQLHDVQVITFDEMFDRTRRLTRLLEQGVAR